MKQETESPSFQENESATSYSVVIVHIIGYKNPKGLGGSLGTDIYI